MSKKMELSKFIKITKDQMDKCQSFEELCDLLYVSKEYCLGELD